MAVVGVGKIASALNLSVRRVQQLAKEGLPREARGQYDAIKCMLWYVRYLQNAIEKIEVPTRDGVYTSISAERTRLLRADADLREMELARGRGLLISLPDYERELADLVLTTKARITAIPARVAPDLVGENSRVMIQAKIDKACRESLAYLEKAVNDGGKTHRLGRSS